MRWFILIDVISDLPICLAALLHSQNVPCERTCVFVRWEMLSRLPNRHVYGMRHWVWEPGFTFIWFLPIFTADRFLGHEIFCTGEYFCRSASFRSVEKKEKKERKWQWLDWFGMCSMLSNWIKWPAISYTLFPMEAPLSKTRHMMNRFRFSQ